jgi:hypothetical protein
MDDDHEPEPVDELIEQRPTRRRQRKATAHDVEVRRNLLRQGRTDRATEWLIESGALDD